MTQLRKSTGAGKCLAIFVLITLVVVLAGFSGTWYVLLKVDQQYGQSSPNLSTMQRLYLSTVILLQASDLTRPAQVAGQPVSITIQQGESVDSIINKLGEAGLISNPVAFRSYLQYTGLDTRLKAGSYQLSPTMTSVEIASAIQSSISADVTLVILPGWRSEEIARSLATSGFAITSESFMLAVHSLPEGYSFSTCLQEQSVEGFLFPGSYSLPRKTGVDELLTHILMNFESQVGPELRDGFSAQDLDLCQAVTLASIVQREAVVEEEMPLIASVFYNRLRSGNTLSSDPTVQYALGYNPQQGTWWTNPLTLQDLQVESAFNTYLNKGLPPGAISNPGLPALKAVAFPADTPYFYFRSACDGSGRHAFAKTYDEHMANACP